MNAAEELINFIATAPKTTPVKVTLSGALKQLKFPSEVKVFGTCHFCIMFGDWAIIAPWLEENKHLIDEDYVVENDGRNTGVPLLDKKEVNARIEPGAVIRDKVEIGDNAVIMMGATINIGAIIGEKTMIDMGAILGGRATVGANCHIGAGAVLAGVIEPASATPVIIEDDVLVGANAVVIEGVRVGQGAVVAAGAIVVDDVAPYTVVAGVPAREIKKIDQKTKDKTGLIDALRNLDK
ncbi:MAG: 2,3,4,5-tetrahydropyridine-2,6-dicarboxylate N-acetyltransferase [Lactobacillales bacterium]|jgi:tetrahydrodipicolinate N-acetyltransferase|nr:2,3,4,5-tetrahydropyridine-2,6-dicarboxylate N-acetyltransferase [Lactobacillales bacterium]